MAVHERAWGRWAAVGVALQFADPIQRSIFGPGPASYVTTGDNDTFELMFRGQGGRPISSFLL